MYSKIYEEFEFFGGSLKLNFDKMVNISVVQSLAKFINYQK